MGEKTVRREASEEALRQFTRRLLRDVEALEHLLEHGGIESGVRRIGAEQELFLVGRDWRPAPIGVEVRAQLPDPRLTSELGRFNLEINLSPARFRAECLSRLEGEILEALGQVREASDHLGADVVLVGILPTLRKSDLSLDNMTPEERYYALNEAVTRLRGGPYDFRIEGAEELHLTHDSVMLEACNASFQVHFQVGPDEFAPLYNLALAISAPVLAAAVNSPLLFGRRLWAETRIALFQQSVDTRSATPDPRPIQPRVSFGHRWVEDSVLEVFREDIARYRVILEREVEDPFAAIERGEAPRLQALQLHNSTVYRWNRPCYGITDGVAHLRIENRILPSGPSVPDEVANAALWFGLVSGLTEEHRDIRRELEFPDVAQNFRAAAQHGLEAQLTWTEGESVPASELLRERLLPLAREGLRASGIAASDIDRYLGIVEERVRRAQTGARWLVRSLASMPGSGTLEERLRALVAASTCNQRHGVPVHEWPMARPYEGWTWRSNYLRVEQYMTTDLLTVTEDEPIELAVNLMRWHRIHHVPVEDNEHRLVGLVSYRPLLRFLASEEWRGREAPVPVSRVMQRELVTVSPETTTREAIETMRRHAVGSLPVVRHGRLVGMVTERDFLRIAGRLLEDLLRD